MSLLILHHHSQRCTNCGREESWSHLYQPEIKGAATRLQPFSGLISTTDSIELLRVPHADVPICSSCVPADATNRGAIERAAWAETLKRKAAEARSTPSSTQPKPLRPIEELA